MIRWLGARSACRVKAPDTAGLIDLQRAIKINGAGHLLEQRVIVLLVDAVEEAALPLAALGLLGTAQFALSVFNAGLVRRDGVHIALLDVVGDVGPCTTALVQILLLERGQGERGGFVVLDDPSVNDLLGAGVLDGEGIRPLAVNGVEGLLLALASLVQARGESVLLAAQPALARVIDLGDVAAAAGDLCGLLQLDEGCAVDQGLDV